MALIEKNPFYHIYQPQYFISLKKKKITGVVGDIKTES